MKCEVCNKERDKGSKYMFFAGGVGPTERKKIGIKTYQETTVHYAHGKVEGWVCRICYLKNLLISEKTVVVIIITGIFSAMDGKFINNFLIGLFFTGLALGGCWLGSLAFFWTQHGDRALIRAYRKKPEYQGYRLYIRSEAHKHGWIKKDEIKI